VGAEVEEAVRQVELEVSMAVGLAEELLALEVVPPG
jgi:hypothetical protein